MCHPIENRNIIKWTHFCVCFLSINSKFEVIKKKTNNESTWSSCGWCHPCTMSIKMHASLNSFSVTWISLIFWFIFWSTRVHRNFVRRNDWWVFDAFLVTDQFRLRWIHSDQLKTLIFLYFQSFDEKRWCIYEVNGWWWNSTWISCLYFACFERTNVSVVQCIIQERDA